MKENKITSSHESGITVSYQSEFMQNYVAESKIDFAKGIRSIRINDDEAIILFIDKIGVLTLLLAENGLAGGWDAMQLSSPGYQTNSFDIYYLEGTNELRIGYSQQKDGRSELMISEELVIDPENVDTIKALHFTQIDIPYANRLIDHITFDKRGVLYSSQLVHTDAMYHYFKYGDRPQKYMLPENTEKVRQLQVGTVYGDFGVFILYDMPGNSRTMLFQSFLAEGETEISQERIEIKQNGRTVLIECFDLIKNDDGNDTIYLAGEGIYKTKSPDSKKEMIAPRSFYCNRIDVAVNEESESIWALHPQDLTLYYLTNTYYHKGDIDQEAQKWTTPLAMHKGTYEFSAIKGNQLSNQLFLFVSSGSSSGIVHLWQDSVSKAWRESDVSIDNLKDSLLINSFTVDLHLNNGNNSTFIKDPITISTEQNFSLYINNQKYQLSPQLPITVPFSSYYNIVYPADSIAVPALTISASFLDEAIVIDPTASLKEKINEKIKNGADLANAKKQDGTPLISAAFDRETLNQAAKAIQKITAEPEKTIDNIALEGSGQMITADLSSLESGNTIGDFLYSVRKGFETIKDFTFTVVDNVWQFVVEIGGKTLKWIAKAASDVMAFLEQVWEKIKVAFKDLVDFLAFLFDWDDILETKEAIKLTVNKVIDLMDPKLKSGKQYVVEKITELKHYSEQLLGLNDKQQLNQNLNDLSADAGSMTEAKPDTRANWVGSKKELIFEGKSTEANGLDTKDLAKLSSNGADPELKGIIDAIADFFNGKINIGQFVKIVAKILVGIAFDFISKMAEALFDIAIALVKAIKEFLNGEIYIPLLSSLYKKISGAELSILDFMSLLTAIPMTIAYKLANQTAPFENFSKEEFASRIALSLT